MVSVKVFIIFKNEVLNLKELNEIAVLDFYLQELESDSISFLKNRSFKKEIIKELIISLKNSKSINEKISIAKNLWKALFDSAMSFIDPNKSGYDTLFKYFDNYVEFEELIFASDSFYRDHTLHCLWVYFLGEYIIKNEEFAPIIAPMNKQLNFYKTMTDSFKELNCNNIFKKIIFISDKLIEKTKFREAVICICALTHDLGYPLKKIDKINKSIKSILPNFSIKNYDEFNFSYTNVDQSFIEKFIKHLSTDYDFVIGIESTNLENEEMILRVIETQDTNLVGINKEEFEKLDNNELETLRQIFTPRLKCLEIPNRYLRYCNDFESYKHGIMSAFLLMKNIRAFSDIGFIENNNANISRDTAFKTFSDSYLKSEILNAISDHTSDGFKIQAIESPSEFLTFIDELEEFSRISRANQNREYVEEFCSTNIYMTDGWFNIDFTFDNTSIDNLNPERAFKGRCERFLSLFDIPNLHDSLKIRLRCIGNLPSNKNIYTLELAHKYAKISINQDEMDISTYLKSMSFYSREEYALI